MTAYFLDSSALVKRYIREPGSAWMRTISMPASGNSILVSVVVAVEVISASSRRRREGTVSLRTSRAIRLLLSRHMQREYAVTAVTTAVIQRAQDLLEQYPLRAYDAIQLGSAIEGNAHLLAASLPPLIFVSADRRLLTVAAAESLTTDDPNAHP